MPFFCFYCSKQFTTKNRVKEHIIERVCLRKIHLCWCGTGCVSLKALQVHNLRHHTTRQKLETTPLQFINFSEFEIWKHAFEEETVAKFVKPRTCTILKNGNKKTKYVCHRSGRVRLKTGERKRAARKKGSCKLNAFCPAFISIQEDMNGVIVGEYYGIHCNHEKEIQHLTLTQKEKEKIAEDLNRGATFEEILDDARNSAIADGKNNVKRIHMLSRKDLHNIMQEFKISFKERLAKDATNVHSFVQDCDLSFGNDSPIKLFKPQNVDGIEGMEGANSEDFILIIMTTVQKQMLIRFQNNQICLDSTYGTKGFDFHLTTIFSVDDSGISLPAAFCISNTVNENIMSIFFSTIMRECGNISAPVFISKDYPMFINPWCKVMSVPQKWQVDQNLAESLQKMNVSVEPGSELDGIFRTLIKEMDDQVLTRLLKKFVTKLLEHESTRAFGRFFENEYAGEASQWPSDYKSHAVIHTNLKLEAMHRMLKDVYFRGIKVRRLDFSIFRLLKMSWDNLFGRLTYLGDEGESYARKILENRHNEALQIPRHNILQREDRRYEIRSSSDFEKTFSVRRENVDCSCRVKCVDCDSCLHVYSCSCIDYRIAGNFCKHVHAVCIFENDPSAADAECGEPDGLKREVVVCCVGNVSPASAVEERLGRNANAKQELMNALWRMSHLLRTNSYDEKVYEEGAKLVRKALNLFRENGRCKGDGEELLNCKPAIKKERLILSPKEGNFNLLKIMDDECVQSHIQIEEVNQILVDDVVEEIVYVDVHTTEDSFC